MATDKKDKSRVRLKERRKATAPAGTETKEKAKSALARGVQRSKNERVAAKQSAPKAPQKGAQAQDRKAGGLMEYMRGVRIETKKVVWPTRKELVSYTVVVFVACAFFALFLWGVDSGFLALIREAFNINVGA